MSLKQYHQKSIHRLPQNHCKIYKNIYFYYKKLTVQFHIINMSIQLQAIFRWLLLLIFTNIVSAEYTMSVSDFAYETADYQVLTSESNGRDSFVAGGYRVGTNTPFLFRRMNDGSELWSIDFSEYDISSSTVVQKVVAVRYSRPPTEFIGVLVEGDQFHMLYVVSETNGKIVRAFPLPKHNFVTGFIEKSEKFFIFQCLGSDTSDLDTYAAFYTNKERNFRIIRVSIKDGTSGSQLYWNANNYYANRCPIVYHDNMIYIGGYVQDSTPEIAGAIVKMNTDLSVQWEYKVNKYDTTINAIIDTFATHDSITHDKIYAIGSTRRSTTQNNDIPKTHKNSKEAIIFIIHTGTSYGSCNSPVQIFKLNFVGENERHRRFFYLKYSPTDDILSIYQQQASSHAIIIEDGIKNTVSQVQTGPFGVYKILKLMQKLTCDANQLPTYDQSATPEVSLKYFSLGAKTNTCLDSSECFLMTMFDRKNQGGSMIINVGFGSNGPTKFYDEIQHESLVFTKSGSDFVPYFVTSTDIIMIDVSGKIFKDTSATWCTSFTKISSINYNKKLSTSVDNVLATQSFAKTGPVFLRDKSAATLTKWSFKDFFGNNFGQISWEGQHQFVECKALNMVPIEPLVTGDDLDSDDIISLGDDPFSLYINLASTSLNWHNLKILNVKYQTLGLGQLTFLETEFQVAITDLDMVNEKIGADFIRVHQGKYMVQHFEYKHWFNTDPAKLYCHPENFVICQETQVIIDDTCSKQEFYQPKSTVLTPVNYRSCTSPESNNYEQTGGMKFSFAYYTFQLDIDISSAFTRSASTKVSIIATCQHEDPITQNNAAHCASQRVVTLDYQILDPQATVSQVCTEMIMNNKVTYDKCADGDAPNAQFDCMCNKNQRIFFGDGQPTKDNLQSYDVFNVTDWKGLTTCSRNALSSSKQGSNQCYCESQGVWVINLQYENGGTFTYTEQDLLETGSSYNSATNAPFSTCTDGSLIKIELLNSNKLKEFGNNEVAEFEGTGESGSRSLKINLRKNSKPPTYYLRAIYSDPSSRTSHLLPLDVLLVINIYEADQSLTFTGSSPIIIQVPLAYKEIQEIEIAKFLQHFSYNEANIGGIQFRILNMPQQMRIGEEGYFYIIRGFDINTMGFQSDVEKITMQMEVYQLGNEANKITVTVELQVLDCSKQSLDIVDPNGNQYPDQITQFVADKSNNSKHRIQLYKQANFTVTNEYCRITKLTFLYSNGQEIDYYYNNNPVAYKEGSKFQQYIFPISNLNNLQIANGKIVNHDDDRISIRIDTRNPQQNEFKIKIETYGGYSPVGNSITRDAKFFVCGTQTLSVQKTDDQYFSVDPDSTENVIDLTQMAKITFSKSDTWDKTQIASLNEDVYSYCTDIHFRLCTTQACNQNYVNSNRMYLTSQKTNINQEEVPQLLNVQTKSPFLERVYFEASNKAGNSVISDIYVEVCGNERIDTIFDESVTIKTNSFGQVMNLSSSKYFSTTNERCPVRPSEIQLIQQSNDIKTKTFEQMFKLVDLNLIIDTRLIDIDFASTIKFDLLVRGSSRQRFTFDCQYTIDYLVNLDFALNTPPQIIGSKEPFVVEVKLPEKNGTLSDLLEPETESEPDIILFHSPEIADYQSDEMTFFFEKTEPFSSFAWITILPQSGMSKMFTLEVDRAKIGEKQLGEYKFMLHALDQKKAQSNIEFELVIEEQKPEEQEEKTQENQEEEKVIENKFEGFIIEEIEEVQQEVVEAIEEEVESEYPEPAITIGKISALGEIPIIFNQPFIVPEEGFDFSKTFTIGVQSSIDTSIAIGQYLHSYKRLLQDSNTTSGCDEGKCEAVAKFFTWSVSDHTQEGLSINLQFDTPKSISTSVYGQDSLLLDIKNYTVFKSSVQDKFLEPSGIPLQQCGNIQATICKLMPPLMSSEETVSAIIQTTENMQSAINIMTSSNLIIAILLGGAVSQLFGMIRLIQILLLSAVMGIVYPAHLTLFYSYCLVFAEMDIFQSVRQAKAFEGKSLNLKETPPYTPVFEQYELQDMSFFMNSGSFNIVVLLILMNGFVMSILTYISKQCFQYRICRKIGQKAQKNNVLRMPLEKLFMEGFIDIVLSSFLNMIAILQSAEIGKGSEHFFNSFNDFLQSVITFVTFFLVFFAPFYINDQIKKNINNLHAESSFSHYFDEYKLNKVVVFYTVYMMIRRIALVLILVIWTSKPWLQSQLITIQSVFHLGFLLGHKPYKTTLSNRVETINEVTVYISALLHVQFLQESDSENILKFKSALGWIIIGNVSLNIVINISIVAIQSIISIYYAVVNGIRSAKLQYKQMVIQRSRAILFNELGEQAFPGLGQRLSEQEALQFCKDFAQDREWCHKNLLDYRTLPEEKMFQEYVIQFKFKERRRAVIEELQISDMLFEQQKILQKAQIAEAVKKKRLQVLQNIIQKNQQAPQKKPNLSISIEQTLVLEPESPGSGYWKRVDNVDGTHEVVFIKTRIKKLPSSLRAINLAKKWISGSPTLNAIIEDPELEQTNQEQENEEELATTRDITTQVVKNELRQNLFTQLKSEFKTPDTLTVAELNDQIALAKQRLSQSYDLMKKSPQLVEIQNLIPGFVLYAGMDIKQIKILETKVQQVFDQNNDCYLKSVKSALKTQIQSLKDEHYIIKDLHERRLNLLDKGLKQDLYQETFDFAIDYDETDEVDLMGQIRQQRVDIQQFLEKTVEEIIEQILDEAVKKQRAKGMIRVDNPVVQCFLEVDQVQRYFLTKDNLQGLMGKYQEIYKQAFRNPYIETYEGKMPMEGSPLEYYLSEVNKLNDEQKDPDSQKMEVITDLNEPEDVREYVNQNIKESMFTQNFLHLLQKEFQCQRCEALKIVYEEQFSLSLRQNLIKFDLESQMELNEQQQEKQRMNIEKLLLFYAGLYSPLNLDSQNSRQTIEKCSQCEMYTKHQIKAKFLFSPETLVLTFHKVGQKQIEEHFKQIEHWNITNGLPFDEFSRDFSNDIMIQPCEQELSTAYSNDDPPLLDKAFCINQDVFIQEHIDLSAMLDPHMPGKLQLITSRENEWSSTKYRLFGVITDEGTYVLKNLEDGEMQWINTQKMKPGKWTQSPKMIFYKKIR